MNALHGHPVLLLLVMAGILLIELVAVVGLGRDATLEGFLKGELAAGG